VRNEQVLLLLGIPLAHRHRVGLRLPVETSGPMVASPNFNGLVGVSAESSWWTTSAAVRCVAFPLYALKSIKPSARSRTRSIAMGKFCRVLAFTFLSFVAAWVGSDLATAQDPPPFNQSVCYCWPCQGTEMGCILTTPGNFLCYCAVDPSLTCQPRGGMAACPGFNSMGMPCTYQYGHVCY